MYILVAQNRPHTYRGPTHPSACSARPQYGYKLLAPCSLLLLAPRSLLLAPAASFSPPFLSAPISSSRPIPPPRKPGIQLFWSTVCLVFTALTLIPFSSYTRSFCHLLPIFQPLFPVLCFPSLAGTADLARRLPFAEPVQSIAFGTRSSKHNRERERKREAGATFPSLGTSTHRLRFDFIFAARHSTQLRGQGIHLERKGAL